MTSSEATARPSAPPTTRTPLLLAFYRDVWDGDGTLTGWQTVAWGLMVSDGSVISTAVEPPVHATLWHSVADAAAALDAYVDSPDPRRTIENWHDVQPPPAPSTDPSNTAVEGAGPSPADRSPRSLAVALARAAERLRTDPEENLTHCAVRGAAHVLRSRLDECLPLSIEASDESVEGQ